MGVQRTYGQNCASCWRATRTHKSEKRDWTDGMRAMNQAECKRRFFASRRKWLSNSGETCKSIAWATTGA